ncbi:hypothetical protein JRA98_001416 [Escherichia coli O28ac]|uniref:Prophage protein n=2 Tax=Enterobacteriaceae TaxID=543 RepID=A0A377HEZ8_ECOLX|nr:MULTISPECIES: hypothetical protein [Enterobacteriaceae]EFY9879793.1 hypothetical protein [Shigella dysenteriae]EHD3367466.1 hypothetical protein [Escherichia coli O28ac]EHD3375881.1 hypothetical protein [Escherichia coli O124]EHD3408074.1 hypothetical protein [Escherichia coli O152]EAA1046592.1 hypothetical protein [Escherichia coli]
MHKIPFEVLIHSENALIKAREMNALLGKLMEIPEAGKESESLMFAAVRTLLTPVIDELNKAMAIHENNNAHHTGE